MHHLHCIPILLLVHLVLDFWCLGQISKCSATNHTNPGSGHSTQCNCDLQSIDHQCFLHQLLGQFPQWVSSKDLFLNSSSTCLTNCHTLSVFTCSTLTSFATVCLSVLIHPTWSQWPGSLFFVFAFFIRRTRDIRMTMGSSHCVNGCILHEPEWL